MSLQKINIYIVINYIDVIFFNISDNFGDDCPVIERLYELCCTYTSASVVAAKMLNEKLYDTVINWSGGLHHAKQ